MTVLGNIAGAASTEFGLSQMIWAGYAASKGEAGYEASPGQVVGLFAGLLCLHGLCNSLKTKQLAFATQFFVFSESLASVLHSRPSGREPRCPGLICTAPSCILSQYRSGHLHDRCSAGKDSKRRDSHRLLYLRDNHQRNRLV